MSYQETYACCLLLLLLLLLLPLTLDGGWHCQSCVVSYYLCNRPRAALPSFCHFTVVRVVTAA
jgi:hypothetical protein